MNSFAALKADGSLVTWGASGGGGCSKDVAEDLKDVKRVFHTLTAFAALKADGSVVSWGDARRGGDSQAVQEELRKVAPVAQVFATDGAFLAIGKEGVAAWGDAHAGGECPADVKAELEKPVRSKKGSRGLHAKVQVLWEGEWYKAEIIEAKTTKNGKPMVKVHYEGYAADWDESLGMDRLKSKHLTNASSDREGSPLSPQVLQARLPVGSRIRAEFDGKFYAAEVLQVSASKKRASAPIKVPSCLSWDPGFFWVCLFV